MMGAEHTRKRAPSLSVRGGLALLFAVLINGVLVVAVETLNIAPGFRALSLPPVAFLSALGAAGATVAYMVTDRYVSDTDRMFVRVAMGVLLLSFLPDIALLALDPAAAPLGVAVLMLMHVVVAAISVGVLVYWRAEQ